MSTKILVIGDTHFGCRSNSDNYLEFMEYYFKNDISRIIEEHNIKDVRILGDLFDNKHSINIKVLNVVIDIFDIFNHKFPDTTFNIITGNHDIYLPDSLKYNSLEVFKNFKNIKIIKSLTKEIINERKVISIPWLIKNTKVYDDFIHLISSGEKFDYLFGHLEINGFEMINNVYCQDGIEKEKIENIFKFIFSGHFHKRHYKNNIYYVGTPYELTWNDFDNQKGVHILNTKNNELTFIPNNTTPKHKKIFISKISSNSIKRDDIENNIVKIIIDKKVSEETISKIISKIEEIKPFKIETEITYIDEVNKEQVHNILESSKDDLASLYIEFLNSDNDIPEEKKELAKKMFIEEYLKIINEELK